MCCDPHCWDPKKAPIIESPLVVTRSAPPNSSALVHQVLHGSVVPDTAQAGTATPLPLTTPACPTASEIPAPVKDDKPLARARSNLSRKNTYSIQLVLASFWPTAESQHLLIRAPPPQQQNASPTPSARVMDRCTQSCR